MIYSDTDSVFFESQKTDLSEAVKLGEDIAKRFSVGGATLEFEQVLDPLFSHGKKKRYVGKVVWPEEGKIIRGYEIRRTDSFDLQSKALETIFEETYGIPVYQEQIMFAAMEMAGYTASEADDLRKAIAKKKAKSLKTHRKKFIQGSVGNDINQKTATEVFDDWENFARYGFNKAHAADYGVIAVQTALSTRSLPRQIAVPSLGSPRRCGNSSRYGTLGYEELQLPKSV